MMATEEQTTSAAAASNERAQHSGPQMPRLPLPRIPIEMPTGTPGRMLWWGGLAALAALEVVEWPVAVLVGAGTWVAEQYAKADTAEHATRKSAESQAAQRVQSRA
jgi:hypothetical protein